MSVRDCIHGQLARSCEICELTAQLATVTAERDALAKALCYLIGEDWPDAGGDTESEKAMSVAIDKQAAELFELRAKVKRAKVWINEYDEGDYFVHGKIQPSFYEGVDWAYKNMLAIIEGNV